MSHSVNLDSAAIVGVQLLTGMATTETDPGVQTASRGTGATISRRRMTHKASSPFFNDGPKRFQDAESVSGSPSGNNGCRRGSCVQPAEEMTNDQEFD